MPKRISAIVGLTPLESALLYIKDMPILMTILSVIPNALVNCVRVSRPFKALLDQN